MTLKTYNQQQERNLYLFRCAALQVIGMSYWQDRKGASVDNHKVQNEALCFIVYKTSLLSCGYYPHSKSLIRNSSSLASSYHVFVYWVPFSSDLRFWLSCYMERTLTLWEQNGETLLICNISLALCIYLFVSMFILFKNENINPYMH